MTKKMKVMEMKRLMKITRTLAHPTIGDRNNRSRRIIMIERSVLITSESYGRMTATTSKK